ncbi:MAG TPA: hypothetical protein VGJ88_10800 [Thermoanaerobaculia bacterium]
MDNFAAALAAIRDLKQQGIIEEYAVGGAMAVAFWTEPTATFDLDVFVQYTSGGMLVSLEPIYTWAAERGYPAKDEHIIISGIPVQVIPAPDSLAAEAIATAAVLDYDGQPMRVIRPEFLIALSLTGSARTQKRVARAAQLLEEAQLDRRLLDDLVRRYHVRLPS